MSKKDNKNANEPPSLFDDLSLFGTAVGATDGKTAAKGAYRRLCDMQTTAS